MCTRRNREMEARKGSERETNAKKERYMWKRNIEREGRTKKLEKDKMGER